MILTRRYRFTASHRLHAPSLSDRENARVYGKCNNPYGHGHNYVMEVVVRGPVDAAGRVIDVAALDDFVRREAIEAFDHKNLNADVPEFNAVAPTSENLAVEAARRLSREWGRQFGAAALAKIRILETARNIFELKL